MTAEWAHRARQAVATAQGGTLHVCHLDRLPAGADSVLLYEEAGRPRFLCDPGSPVARAADRGRHAALELPCPRWRWGIRAVVLGGQLRVLGHEDAGGQPVRIVGLVLDSVSVDEHRCGESPGVARSAVPLQLYLDASPDEQLHAAVPSVDLAG